MKNETVKKNAFLTILVLGTFCISKVIGGADLFATITLALIVGIFCWDIEEFFCILKNDPDKKYDSSLNINNNDIRKNAVTAYILNLDRAKDRWKFMQPQIKKLKIPYERISAIDGKELSEKFIKENVDRRSYGRFFKMLPEKGTIGCSLSHEKALRRFLQSSDEFALIFEDDVKFDPKILAETVQSAIQQKHLWDIVSFELNHYGYPQKISRLEADVYLVFYMTNVKHSGAYLINRMAAERLLQRFFPIKMAWDHYFTRSWEFGIRFCGVEPRIVEQKFGNSQIKDEKMKKFNDNKTLLINLGYNIYTAVMQTIYNFYLYLSSRRRL